MKKGLKGIQYGIFLNYKYIKYFQRGGKKKDYKRGVEIQYGVGFFFSNIEDRE